MRRAAVGLGVASVVFLAAGCYRPRALEPQTVLDELRAEDRAAGSGRPRGGTPPAGGAVTADEAVALALRWNPDLRAMRHEEGAAEGQITAARALNNPTVDLQLLHLQDLSQKAWAVELGWAPPQPGVYAARNALARANLEAVRDEIAEAELEVELAVRAAHAITLSMAEQRAIIEQGLAARRRIVELVQKRVAGGVSTRVDLSLAQLGVAEIEHDRDDLAAKEIQGGQQLAALVGARAPLHAAGELPADATPPSDIEGLEQTALRARPAVQAAKARYGEREQAVRIEHEKVWPAFKLTGRYRQNDTSSNPDDFMVGVQLSLPLLDQNRGRIRVAEESRNQERERFRKVLGSVRREIAAALEELALREQTLQRYRETVLPSLAAHEQLLAAATAGGQLDLIAVLRAQDVILRARRDYCELRLAYHRARLALERATGRHATTEQKTGE